MSNWKLLEFFLPMALVSEVNALIDIKGGKVAINNGADKVSDGFDFVEGTDNVNTNFNGREALIAKTNDVEYAVFVKTNQNKTSDMNLLALSTGGGGSLFFHQQFASNRLQSRINTYTSSPISGGGNYYEDNTLYSFTRTATNLTTGYKNGISIGTANTNVAGQENGTVVINSQTASGNPLTAALSLFSAGAGIGVNQVAKNDHYTAFLRELGVLVEVSPEAQIMLDNYATYGVALSGTEREEMTRYVNQEVLNGNHALKDFEVIFSLAGVNALVDYIGGTVLTNNGATFDLQGATFAGAQYIDTGWVPNVNASNYGEGNRLFGAWAGQNATAASSTFIGTANSSSTAERCHIEQSPATPRTLVNVDSRNFLVTDVDDALYVGDENATGLVLYRNGVIGGSRTSAPVLTLRGQSYFLGARNQAGSPTTYWTGTIRSAMIGASIGFTHSTHHDNHLQLLINLDVFAQPVIDRFTGLSTTEENAIRKFVNAEAKNGNWFLYDEFFCFSLVNTPANALIGFKSKTATNNGAVLDINGATFAGAEWVDTNWTPSVDAVNYKLDDANISVFSITPVDGNQFGVLSDGNANRIQCAFIPGLQQYRINTSGGANGLDSVPNSFLASATRIEFGRQRYYKDGVLIDDQGRTSTGLPTLPVYVGGLNSSGVHTNGYEGKIPSLTISAGIGFDQAAHNTNLRALLTDLGVTI